MRKLLTETQVAEQLLIKKNTLRKWRLLGKGPAFDVATGNRMRNKADFGAFSYD